VPPPAYLQRYWRAVRGSGVPAGPEFRRVDALPRREFDPKSCAPAPWEAELWRPEGCGRERCVYNGGLLPTQRAACQEGLARRGLVGSLGLGHGKTLISFLLATLLQPGPVVLLVSPSLRQQTRAAWEHLSKHWKLAPVHVVAYSELSSPKHGDVLERLAPRVVVADEAHCLANPKAARTKRFLRYFAGNPGTLFVALSGTLTNRSLRDWGHLSRLALGPGSPAPVGFKVIEDWSFAVDDMGEGMEPAPGGALNRWCRPDETTREGWGRRVRETPGVAATRSQECDATLVLRERRIKLPEQVDVALTRLRKLWVRPDGVELASGPEFYRHARTLSMGFYLRWVEQPPQDWLEARKAWVSERSGFLSRRSTPGLDSPALYEQAVISGRVASRSYQRWKDVEHQFRPTTEPVWLSEFMVQDVAALVQRGSPLVVWSRHPAFGAAVAEAAGIPYYGAGKTAELLLLEECETRGDRSIVVSLQSHYQGRNMQAWSHAIWPGFSANGRVVEQCLGRLHRQGQRADQVEYLLYLHTPESIAMFGAAWSSATHQQTVFGQPQRLLGATLALDSYQ
jgi:hypothetical protein